MTTAAHINAGDGSRTVTARGSRVVGFSLSFVVGVVIGMLGTFATFNGRLVAVEVQVTGLAETIHTIRDEQLAQQAQLDRLDVQLARLGASDDAPARKRPQ